MKIAITGKMCSGKSTIANMIIQYNPNYKKYSFGQKIKDIAVDLFNMKQKDRSLLIQIGGHMREIDNDVWVNYLIKNVKNNENCVIDDLRYQNELDNCLNNDFKIIQLVVSKEEQIKRIKKLYPNNYLDHIKNLNHISEVQTFNFKNTDVLILDTSTMTNEKIKHELFLFLTKN